MSAAISGTNGFDVIFRVLAQRRIGDAAAFTPIELPPGTVLQPIPEWLARRPARDLPLGQLLSESIADIGGKAALVDTELMSDCWLELDRRRRRKGANSLSRAMSAAGVAPIPWLPKAREALAALRRPSKGVHRLYAILLGGFGRDGSEYGVYIGETRHDPEARFLEHLTDADPKTGVVRRPEQMRISSRFVRRRGIELLPSLVAHLDRLSPADAKNVEREAAELLKAAGIRVRGGR